jgi:tripartite-type tricarboxylate transporter receptor subunit TctC
MWRDVHESVGEGHVLILKRGRPACVRELGVSTIVELIAKAKRQKITYGSPGVGSQLHLLMELFRDKTGADLQHVPYRGASQALVLKRNAITAE